MYAFCFKNYSTILLQNEWKCLQKFLQFAISKDDSVIQAVHDTLLEYYLLRAAKFRHPLGCNYLRIRINSRQSNPDGLSNMYI